MAQLPRFLLIMCLFAFVRYAIAGGDEWWDHCPSSSETDCCDNDCVCDKSKNYKVASLSNWGINALHYVCRFTDDAERNCGAVWER